MKTKISDLVIEGHRGMLIQRPSMDPFEVDALQEATLLSSLFISLSSTVALLFDLRTSLYFAPENTGVLTLHGVSRMTTLREWTGMSRVWVVSGCETVLEDQFVRVRLADVDGGSIDIQADSADFFTGVVAGIGDVAAEIGENHETAFLRTIPNWESKIEVTGAVTTSARSEET